MASAEVAIRFVNVAPSDTAVDFCIGPVDNVAGPVAKVGGASGGLVFKAVMTYGYHVTGPVDLKVIKAGDACSGAGLAQISNLSMTDLSCANSVSVYYLTDMNGTGSVVVLQNLPSDEIRFACGS